MFGWFKKIKKPGFNLTSAYMKKVVNFLERHGYIQREPGYKGLDGKKSQDSKMRFTGKVRQLIPLLEGIFVYRDPAHLARIKMKGTKKIRVVAHTNKSTGEEEQIEEEYRAVVLITTKDKAKILDKNLLKYYSILTHVRIELDISQVGLAALNFSRSSDPNKYISWYLSVPIILINGMPVIRRDFSSLHPAMCYALARPICPQGTFTRLMDIRMITGIWKNALTGNCSSWSCFGC